MKPSQLTLRQRALISDVDIEKCLRRADKRHGLLAIPQPPRWPLYAAVFAVVLALAGIVGMRHAELRFVRFDMDVRSVESGR